MEKKSITKEEYEAQQKLKESNRKAASNKFNPKKKEFVKPQINEVLITIDLLCDIYGLNKINRYSLKKVFGTITKTKNDWIKELSGKINFKRRQ